MAKKCLPYAFSFYVHPVKHMFVALVYRPINAIVISVSGPRNGRFFVITESFSVFVLCSVNEYSVHSESGISPKRIQIPSIIFSKASQRAGILNPRI